MITMQLTATDSTDAKTVIEAAVDRGWVWRPDVPLTIAEVGMLYDAWVRAQSQVGTVFDVVPMVEQPQPIVRRRLQRRKKAIKP